ncbi:MAG: hypothetical protein N3A65_09830 [candidate division WOR-3 bacterium]|nr:hypothetical protein [candidate division WOR-3 bacterium]
MNIILLSIFSASIFSLEGLGQEQVSFIYPFYGNLSLARIEISLRPEWNVLNEGKNIRGIFWTNPFYLDTKIPVHKRFTISFGTRERFSQVFDIYSVTNGLDMYVQGRGGIEEIYLQFNQCFNIAEIFCRGSYLYGNSREVWQYTIGGYSIADTFFYKNSGEIFSAGLKFLVFSIFYEGMGKLKVLKSIDTTYNLPGVLGTGLEYRFKDWEYILSIEHTFTDYFNPVNRFKIHVQKRNLGLYYAYNPWYIKGITEHRAGFSIPISIRNSGVILLNPAFGVRSKDSLKEFVFIPELKLVLEELFARRKK